MKMDIIRGLEKSSYDTDTGFFVGDSDLTEFLNTYINAFIDIGSDPLYLLYHNADKYDIQITEYFPEKYPDGTLDV